MLVLRDLVLFTIEQSGGMVYCRSYGLVFPSPATCFCTRSFPPEGIWENPCVRSEGISRLGGSGAKD
jgi:hypothetical protein